MGLNEHNDRVIVGETKVAEREQINLRRRRFFDGECERFHAVEGQASKGHGHGEECERVAEKQTSASAQRQIGVYRDDDLDLNAKHGQTTVDVVGDHDGVENGEVGLRGRTPSAVDQELVEEREEQVEQARQRLARHVTVSSVFELAAAQHDYAH